MLGGHAKEHAVKKNNIYFKKGIYKRMKEYQFKISLFELEKKYLSTFFRKSILPLIVISIITDILKLYISKMLIGINLILVNYIFLLISNIILFLAVKIILDKKYEKKEMIKVVIKVSAIITAYLLITNVLVLINIIPAIILQIIYIVLDLLLMKSFYIVLENRYIKNTKEDNIFFVKYGIEYYIVRIIFILIIGIVTKQLIQIVNPKLEIQEYLNAIYNLVKILLLPVVCFYFDYKKNNKI